MVIRMPPKNDAMETWKARDDDSSSSRPTFSSK